jgi:hypothetical protein
MGDLAATVAPHTGCGRFYELMVLRTIPFGERPYIAVTSPPPSPVSRPPSLLVNPLITGNDIYKKA